MKNKEIATLLRASADELLCGEVQAYKATSDKDPFLVRINDIQATVPKKPLIIFEETSGHFISGFST